MFKLLLLSLAFTYAFAYFGVDFSVYQGALSTNTLQCFKNNGVSFAVIQLWEQPGIINQYFAGNYANAKAAGIAYVDAYAFICPKFSAQTICSGVKNHLPGGFSGQVWLDIEPSGSCWTGSYESRMSFVESVATTCQEYGLNMGVYSSYGSWGGVMGSAGASSGVLTRLPLWYAHWDNSQSFGDFGNVRFGGWGKANIKQYKGNGNLCGTTVDLNYYP
jgi:GH25 family lysozyme M1 (1,4-beta-N-acetylmuramidase)